MQKIVPSLWFDKEAKEAAEFYVSVFDNAKVVSTSVINGTPSGSVDIVSMEIEGYAFSLISAGPLFKFNPSISFFICCGSKEEADEKWAALSKGGKALMEMGKYEWSEKFGWLEDKYGLSWQVIYVEPEKIKQKIVPSLLFTGGVAGKAEEAMAFYASIFRDSETGFTMRYGPDEAPEKEATIKYGHFILAGQEFAAMDSAREHGFQFNEAISFIVNCEDQKEIDYFWERLSAVPESEQCGWLKDKYGLSWQIVPKEMDRMIAEGNREQVDRVTKAFLEMKKFDIAKLRRAYEGIN